MLLFPFSPPTLIFSPLHIHSIILPSPLKYFVQYIPPCRLEEINARLHHIEEEKERESEDRMVQEEEIKKKEEERNDLLTQLVEEKRR